MESFEFLGGRYNRPEQIMSGPVQAFRAQNAASGRIVFIHRVSTTEAPEEQSALLKLLTTALVKSTDAKRLVLDFGEERGYWYVVTESEPQCALLREWLQLEVDAAFANSRLGSPSPAPPVTKAPAPPAPAKNDPTTDTGEFTRFLKARPPLDSPLSTSRFIPQTKPPAPPETPPVQPTVPQAPSAGEFTRLFQSSENPSAPGPMPPSNTPPPPAPPTRPGPGEFTSFFNAGDSERQQSKQFSSGTPQRPPLAEPPPSAPPSPGPAQAEAGEFTRFFKSGLPPSPPKPSAPSQPINFDRGQNNPFVQRPNTPVSPPTASSPKPLEKGEFTQLFSRPEGAKPSASTPPANFQPPAPVRNDPLGFATPPSGQQADLSDNLFNDRIDIPNPSPSSQPQQSEFTRMFGSAGAAPPPVQQQAVVAPPRDRSMLDESMNENPQGATQQFPITRPSNPAPSGNETPPNSPSEFTMIMQGGYGPSKPPAGTGNPPTGGSIAPPTGSGAPAFNLSSLKAGAALSHPPVGGSAHAGPGGASVASPLGSASIAPPKVPAANLKVPPPNVSLPASPKGAANKKMIIFFVVLGALAVLLVVLMLFLMRGK